MCMTFYLCRTNTQHQIWAHAVVEEEVENKELLAESRSRYISFPGRFTPVSHYCNAPLGNGNLCQRQDRYKVLGQTQSDSRDSFPYCLCVCLSCDYVSSSVLSMARSFLETRRVDPAGRRTDWGRSRRRGGRGRSSLVRSDTLIHPHTHALTVPEFSKMWQRSSSVHLRHAY